MSSKGDNGNVYDQFMEFLRWMDSYTKETENYSFYDLEAYVYKNRPDDIRFFKRSKYKGIISGCLKGLKREAGATYKTSRIDAMMNSSKAYHEYTNDQLNKMEESVLNEAEEKE